MKTIFLCIQNKFHTGTVFRVALIDSRSSCTCVFVTPSVWTCAHCFSILDPGIIEISPRDKKKEQTNETSATNTVFKDFFKNVYFSFNCVTQFNFYDYSMSGYIWIIALP